MVFIPFPPGSISDPPVVDSALSIQYNRDLTVWFIEQDPTQVVLIPRVRSRTATGAYVLTDGTPRPMQRVKFAYGGNTGAGRAGIVEAGDGRERMFSYVMIMRWDAQVAPGDHFTDEHGQHWEVEELLPNNDYEVKCTVRSYGQEPQYA